MDYFLVSGWTFCHFWSKFAGITTIIFIETEVRLITVAKIPTTPGTTITRETGTGTTSPTTVSSLMTGEGNWKQKIRAFSKKSVQSPRKSSEAEGDVLKSLSSRTYSRYDDRYYGREDPYYANNNVNPREPAYYDQRYPANTNSYRGNGKDRKSDRSRVLIWSITRCWFI